jgi:hypothetical protein
MLSTLETPLLISSKQDTRKFGFSLNYKIQPKNKPKKPEFIKREERRRRRNYNAITFLIILKEL